MTATLSAPPLACRLRQRTGGRTTSPLAGEVILENVSAAPLEVRFRTSPLEHLTLVVTDPQGTVLSVGRYGDQFSPTPDERALRLLPGEVYTAPVSLLSTVPEGLRRPGTFIVRAVFEYNGFRSVAPPHQVDWPA